MAPMSLTKAGIIAEKTFKTPYFAHLGRISGTRNLTLTHLEMGRIAALPNFQPTQTETYYCNLTQNK